MSTPVIIREADQYIQEGKIHELDYELLLIMEVYYWQTKDIENETIVRSQIEKRQDLTNKLLSGIL